MALWLPLLICTKQAAREKGGVDDYFASVQFDHVQQARA